MADVKDILKKRDALLLDQDLIQRGYREGVEIEKGVILNESYLKDNE